MTRKLSINQDIEERIILEDCNKFLDYVEDPRRKRKRRKLRSKTPSINNDQHVLLLQTQLDKYALYPAKRSTRSSRNSSKRSNCKGKSLITIEGDRSSKVSKVKQPLISQFFGNNADNARPNPVTFTCTMKKKPPRLKPMPKPPSNNLLFTNYT